MEFVYTEELKSFLDAEGRLKAFPTKQRLKIIALFYLATKFEEGKHYTEMQVNQVLKQWHTFSDWAMLRRELFDRHFLNRALDCSAYWKAENQPTPASFGL